MTDAIREELASTIVYLRKQLAISDLACEGYEKIILDKNEIIEEYEQLVGVHKRVTQ